MYEYVPVQRVVDDVWHIYDLYRDAAVSVKDSAEERRARMLFLRGLINNLQHAKSQPSPRVLMELSRRIPLTTGGSFKLLGYRLERMREVDFLLNGHRTRIIESYPFYRDREIDLPGALSEQDVFKRNVFVSEIVLRWQRGLPIRALHGPEWRRDGIFHVQIGVEDSLALSGIPPGAILSVEPVSSEEQSRPDPKAVYCLQFGNGYRCCSCAVSRGKLILLPQNGNYAGPYEFFYPQEVRIVGRARGFAVSLPPVLKDWPEMHPVRASAPLVLPWEQPSFHDLLRTKRMRFGLTGNDLDRANGILESLLGTGISRRTLRRYERESDGVPHTDVLLALTVFHAARFRDVLKTLHFWKDESAHYSLTTWLQSRTLQDLSANMREAITPEPRNRWKMVIKEWGEWPALLSMILPRMEQFQHRLLRIHQNDIFDGLDPLIRPGAVALLEEADGLPDTHNDRRKHDWDRPIYAIRYGRELLCGYVENDGQRLTLIPHPKSSARRISFSHHRVTVAGRFAAIASPF